MTALHLAGSLIITLIYWRMNLLLVDVYLVVHAEHPDQRQIGRLSTALALFGTVAPIALFAYLLLRSPAV